MEGLLDVVAITLTSHLSPANYAPLAASCSHCAIIAETAAEKQLAATLPCRAARAQLMRLLGSNGKARPCMLWRTRGMKREQDIAGLQSVSRNMVMHPWIGSAQIDGPDVFAACKRAMLVSETPVVVTGELEAWMQYVVDAIENNRFELSIPAWQRFAEQEVLDQGGTFYLFQLAHALEALPATIPLLNAFPQLLEHTNTLANMLATTPSMGGYGPQHCRVKERDLRRLLSKATPLDRNDSNLTQALTLTKVNCHQHLPFSVMLRSRRGQTGAVGAQST